MKSLLLEIDQSVIDKDDSGTTDVVGTSDITFNSTRNKINVGAEINGSDIANYLEKAAEINDEIETVPFALELDDGGIVKVFVNADDADAFQMKMAEILGVDVDVEDAINTLAQDFDIVDVIWPDEDEDGDGIEDEFEPLSDSASDQEAFDPLLAIEPVEVEFEKLT